MTIRIVRGATTGLACVAAVVLLAERFAKPLPAGLECALQAIFVFRFLLLMTDVVRKERPWPRMIVPALLMIKVFFPQLGWARVSVFGAALAELAILGLVVKAVLGRRQKMDFALPEERLRESFSTIVPAGLAKVMAVEMVVLWSAVRAVLHGFKARERTGFDYASASVVGALPMIVLIMGPGDLFLFRAILRIQNPLVDLALVAVDVWSILWLYGIYVTMQERPHVIDREAVTVHKGILKSALIPLNTIRETSCLAAGSFTRADLRGGIRLTVPGAPCVRLELAEPVAVKRVWGKDVEAETVFVSAGDPAGFVDRLRREKIGG